MEYEIRNKKQKIRNEKGGADQFHVSNSSKSGLLSALSPPIGY